MERDIEPIGFFIAFILYLISIIIVIGLMFLLGWIK